MKIKYLLAFSLIFSCAPTIKNFEKYQKQFVAKTEFMPNDSELEGKSPKVAVFDFDNGEIEVAKQAELGKSVAKNLENILSKYRLAEIVDRSVTTKLQKEIALSEMNKTGSYKGPKVADYAISGVISNADFVSKYSSGFTYFDPKSKNLISTPPKFTYSSNVTGNIKIYELPSLTVIETIELNGKKIRTENVQQNGGLSLGGIKIGGENVKGTSRDDGLIRQAGEEALDDAKTALRNALAKKGYILEKRIFENKTIFKQSLGSLDGIKQGDEFEIIGQYEVENPINGKNEIEKRIIASGKVSDKIDPKTSWILINDKKQEDSIRIGDAVKMKYLKSSFESIAKMAKSAASQF